MEKGENSPCVPTSFILTPSAQAHLTALARTVIFSTNAILLEGPTSSGKTSMVKFLAELTGHKLVRINNHHHTDIEEYVGTYTTDQNGNLVFVEGPLVKAVKEGHFLLLDELNLASSEVLEALNRLLDDNRQLLVNETQSVLEPHPHFRLFATQNPTSGYAGRKELSAAFRNRFVEFFISQPPDIEFIEILHMKGKLAPSYGKALVNVMRELQTLRQRTRTFMGRQGFISIRDLLKIAKREPVGYYQLAHFTFMVLGEKIRNESERNQVKTIISSFCKNEQIDMRRFYDEYFSQYEKTLQGIPESVLKLYGLREIKWNSHMKRLLAIIDITTKCKEGILLVGETGTSKTTICQILSLLRNLKLVTINCHQNIETSDLIGGLRPVRNRELHRTIVSNYLESTQDPYLNDMTVALENKVQRIKDINPPEEILDALEKAVRLFEWIDGPLVESHSKGHVLLIDEISLADDSVLERLNSVLEEERTLVLPEKDTFNSEQLLAHDSFCILATMNPGGDYGKKELSPALRNRFTEIWVELSCKEIEEIILVEMGGNASFLIQFIEWYNLGSKVPLSLRDALSWSDFIKSSGLLFEVAYWESLNSILLDSLDSESRAKCEDFIVSSLGLNKPIYDLSLAYDSGELKLGHFSLKVQSLDIKKYSFKSATVKENLLKLIRGLHLSKPILLEGPPGVGKTTIVETLAKLVGIPVTRINLSDETELMDLLGCDYPIGNRFEWSDGVLLTAIKNGHWVILDELNLCPQPIIEGLNSLLDHRATVYIPEINTEVSCPPSFRVFGAQNPLIQGGGRKGLPKSFLNRFTKIRIEELKSHDFTEIVRDIYPDIGNPEMLVEFNEQMKNIEGPWDFNLRDIMRLCEGGSLEMIYYDRLRNEKQINKYQEIYSSVLGENFARKIPFYRVTPDSIQINEIKLKNSRNVTDLELIPKQMTIVYQVVGSVQKNWPVLLCGDSGVGKSSIVKLVCSLYNNSLSEYTLSSNTDSSELLGSFEITEDGKFEWFESTLARAIQQGNWILLKHANTCSSAVLDRINSLLEPNGKLLVNERGLVNGEPYILIPHEDFRVFLSFNPKLGEVSRALRNRCVELYVDAEYCSNDLRRTGITVDGPNLNSLVKWKRISENNQNPSGTYELLFGRETMDIINPYLYVSLNDFIADPVDAYIREDLSFVESFNRHEESVICFIGNSCLGDLDLRCESINLKQCLQEKLREVLSGFSEMWLPVLDCYLSAIPKEEIIKIYCFIGFSLNSDELFIDEISYFLSLAESNFSKYKIDKLRENPVHLECPIPVSLLSTWKNRFKIPKMKHQDIKSSVILNTVCGSKWILPNYIMKSKFRINCYNDTGEPLEIGLILDKESSRYEEIQILSQYSILYEHILFRVLSEDIHSFLPKITNIDYLPKRVVDCVWVLRQDCPDDAAIRLIAWEILQLSPKCNVDFVKIINDISETSLLDAPVMSFLLRDILNWPRSSNSLTIPAEYISITSTELHSCAKDSTIDKLLSENGSIRLVGLGLWLYKHFIQIKQDPSELYTQLSTDYSSLIKRLEEKLRIREQYTVYRHGFNPVTSLELFYSGFIIKFKEKLPKIHQKIIQRPCSLSEFFEFTNSLFSYKKLSHLINHALYESFNSGYILNLIHTFMSKLQAFNEICPDLAWPLLEALHLLNWGLHSPECTSAPPVFPLPLAETPDSYANLLIKAHLFSETSYFPALIARLREITAPTPEPLNTFMIKLRKIVTFI